MTRRGVLLPSAMAVLLLMVLLGALGAFTTRQRWLAAEALGAESRAWTAGLALRQVARQAADSLLAARAAIVAAPAAALAASGAATGDGWMGGWTVAEPSAGVLLLGVWAQAGGARPARSRWVTVLRAAGADSLSRPASPWWRADGEGG